MPKKKAEPARQVAIADYVCTDCGGATTVDAQQSNPDSQRTLTCNDCGLPHIVHNSRFSDVGDSGAAESEDE